MASLKAIGALLTVPGVLALSACAQPRGAQQSLAACPGSGSGSGFTTRGQHELIYAISQDSAGPQLDAGVVVHARREWRRRPPPDSQPQNWRADGVPRAINGATAGPIWIGHERATGTIWLDSVPIPLHTNNVLLLEVGADDVPRLVGRARVDSRLTVPGGSCRPPRTREEAEAFQQALWTLVRGVPQVNEFLDR
jgi:hypothetical protein